MCIIFKIDVFLLSVDKYNKFVEKANVSSNKSKISFKSIKAKIYICKMFKTFFCIIF